MHLEPNTPVERYVVEALLGRGGMAVVYRVRHQQLETLHALKLLTVTSPSIRHRLLQEGKVQAKLRHPNIVAVTDVIEVDGSPGLVMELVEGPSLENLIQARRLSMLQIDALAHGIFAGVGHAHRLGFIHRDLKPANILLQVSDTGLFPKVADFGLAKVLASDEEPKRGRTRSGATMGTPAYMAPEQIRSTKHADKRADVFSLGAILYELVCGRKAFENDDLLELYNTIARGDFVRPRELVPELSQRMEAAILAALQVDRDVRVAEIEALRGLWFGQWPFSTASAQGAWTHDVMELARRHVPPAEDPAVDDRESGPSNTYVGTPAPLPRVANDPSVTTIGKLPPSDNAVVQEPPTATARPIHSATTAPNPARYRAPAVASPLGRWIRVLTIAVAAGGLAAAAPLAVWQGWLLLKQRAGEHGPPGRSVVAAEVLTARAAESVVTEPTTALAVEPPPPSDSIEPPTVPKPSGTSRPKKPTTWLYVNSKPWSQVSFDGAAVGPTNWKHEVQVGSHDLVLQTQDGREFRQSIDVPGTGPTYFCWDFALKASCPRN